MLKHSPTLYKNIINQIELIWFLIVYGRTHRGSSHHGETITSTKIFFIPVSINYIGKPSWVFHIINRTLSTKSIINTMYGRTHRGSSHNEKKTLQPKFIERYWYHNNPMKGRVSPIFGYT